MPRRVQDPKLPAVAVQAIAVAQQQIGGKVAVDPLAAGKAAGRGQRRHRRTAPRAGIAEGEDRRPGRRGQRPGQRRMVEMGMGDDDLADHLAGCQRRQKGRQMGRIGRPRIDHRHPALAEDIGVGAELGHRRRVRRQNPAQSGFRPLDHAGARARLRGGSGLRHLVLSLPVARG